MSESDSIMMNILDLQDRVEDLEIRDTPSTSAASGSIHAPVTLGGGNDAALALSTQELTLTAAWLRTDGASSMAGDLNVGDNDITNVGDIALDSISSDAGTSVTVTLGTDAGDDFIVGNNSTWVVEGDNDRVGVGTSTPSGKLHILGTADEVQQIIQANGTQTNNLTEWQNSSGTARAVVRGDMSLSLTASSISNPIFEIVASTTSATGVDFQPSVESSTASFRGIRLSPTLDPQTSGLNISGVFGIASVTGTNNINRFSGNKYRADLAAGYSGTVTEIRALEVSNSVISGGAATTQTGLYINSITSATNQWAIYTNDGQVRFGDNVQIDADSKTLAFGAGQDATIQYDGTDFLIDAQAVGSGHVVLNSPKTTTGDPTGVEGKIYWNTFDNVIKMYADSAWRTLASW